MSADDQHFLDLLSAIPNDVKKYSLEIADSIDRHFESVAATLRETINSSTWIPHTAKPAPPPPAYYPPLPVGYLERAQGWVSRNRALTAAILAFVGTSGLMIYSQNKASTRKRRARRASNGARKEVVVIAGSPHEPITRSIALDLERRGFIVYIVVSTVEEEQAVQNEARVDIRPLNIDIVDPTSSHTSLDAFARLLQTPYHAFPGASPHNLTLAGLLILPSLSYPSGPIETLSPSIWSDTLNTKVLHTVTTVSTFLPLLKVFSNTRLLLLTPNIISSLQLPFHALESAAVTALESYVNCLRSELATAGGSSSNYPSISHIKLGTFDTLSSSPNASSPAAGGANRSNVNSPRADVLTWAPSARAAYARTYLSLHPSATFSSVKGSSLRELHGTVFEALTSRHPKSTYHVGRGSVAYEVVGGWMPRGLVGWMMGLGNTLGGAKELEVVEELGPGVMGSLEWERVERDA
ncbi:MAG: hypothetical protein M1819_002556 [Sarea resinae]|nr:MAG: hypothetical protein M1819_002556 [Sarea resinae]